jgi:broad specificity phosphatase PhoE
LSDPLLLLIRHGATACSEARRYCGHHDPPLSDLGRAQAAALQPRLAPEPIVAVYASDLARARQTAALALPGRPPTTDPALREIDLGDWDGCTHDEIGARWAAEHARWCDDRFHSPIPGGENGVALLARVQAAVARIRSAHPAGAVAVFTHGGPIAALRCHAAGRPMPEYADLLPALGELVLIRGQTPFI